MEKPQSIEKTEKNEGNARSGNSEGSARAYLDELWVIPHSVKTKKLRRSGILYRIFTEDKNRDKVKMLTRLFFPEFTMHPADGEWDGYPEKSLIIEVALNSDRDAEVNTLAEMIKKTNKQQAILILRFENENWLI